MRGEKALARALGYLVGPIGLGLGYDLCSWYLGIYDRTYGVPGGCEKCVVTLYFVPGTIYESLDTDATYSTWYDSGTYCSWLRYQVPGVPLQRQYKTAYITAYIGLVDP